MLKTILLFLAPLTTKLRFHWWSQKQKLWLLYSAQPSLAVHCSSNIKKNKNIIIYLSYFFLSLFLLHFFFLSLSLCFFSLSSFLQFISLQITLPHPPTQTSLAFSLSPTMVETVAMIPINTITLSLSPSLVLGFFFGNI